LRDDDGVGVSQQRDERRQCRQGILADQADRPGRVPASAGVFVAGGLDEIVEGSLRILAKFGDVVDHEHPGILLGSRGERLPQGRK
jgi:hypothetical protein